MHMQQPEQRPPNSPPRTITPFSVAAVTTTSRLRFPLSQYELAARVRQALEEDSAFNDITTIATVVSSRHARAKLVARQDGTIAGVPLALEAFRQLDPKISIRIDAEDGQHVRRGTTVLFLTGHARGLLSAERTALNFMQRLSGIASLTSQFVNLVRGTRAKILDTRKTTPGWRALEKYAVRAGGGTNHRMDLADSVLIKDNHLRAVDGDVKLAIRRTRELDPNAKVEVECDNERQVQAALDAKADIVLLDNMPLEEMRKCVALVEGRALVEASGGVNLETVRAIAETGVDFISVGALTHSPPAMNLALDFE
ncbi:MAG: carboxylating nicotinate-nucleotide diphosphorylase [Gemmatimonadota bacterium]